MWSNPAHARGLLFVISAPSGTGKTTVVDLLIERCPALGRSRSYTSRPARPSERDGVDYNFVSRPAFEAMVRQDAFLEWADIFGNLYGTARRDIEAMLAGGIDLVLVIDVQGARQVRARMPEALFVFLKPPSWEELVRRLVGRGTETEEERNRRLETAKDELAAEPEFDVTVENTEVHLAAEELVALMEGS
jgi:guanylate kinase